MAGEIDLIEKSKTTAVLNAFEIKYQKYKNKSWGQRILKGISYANESRKY